MLYYNIVYNIYYIMMINIIIRYRNRVYNVKKYYNITETTSDKNSLNRFTYSDLTNYQYVLFITTTISYRNTN
jgi:uncharacterized protein (DUF4213/DUF364 family)